MVLVLIVLLTIISIALRLASTSVLVGTQIANRSMAMAEKGYSKVSKGKAPDRVNKSVKTTSKVGRKVMRSASRVTRVALNTVRRIVTVLRNILVAILPAIIIIDVILLLLLVASSTGYLLLNS